MKNVKNNRFRCCCFFFVVNKITVNNEHLTWQFYYNYLIKTKNSETY